MNTIDSNSMKKLIYHITSLVLVALFASFTALSAIISADPVIYDNEEIQKEIRDMRADFSTSIMSLERDMADSLLQQEELLRMYSDSYDQLTALNLAFLEWAEGQGLIIREESDV